VVVHPFESKNKHGPQDNGLTTTIVKNTYDEDEFFKTFWHEKNKGLCPYGQVPQRNKTVCCYVTSCGPGKGSYSVLTLVNSVLATLKLLYPLVF
jgi:hypothetical protein